MRRELDTLRHQSTLPSNLEQPDFATASSDQPVVQSGASQPLLSLSMPDRPIAAPMYSLPRVALSPVRQPLDSTEFSPILDGVKIELRKLDDCFSL